MRGGALDGREVLCLLGTDTVCFDIQLVSFQRDNLGRHMFTLEMQAVCSSKMLLLNYQTKRRLLLEESNLETYHYKNIRFT
jgi:hypothetical protein